MTDSNTLSALVNLTRTLGEPHRDYVIIGEGNTSARIDDGTFYVKASGQRMENISAEGFVAVNFDPILGLLDNPPQTNSEQKAIMNGAKVDTSSPLSPSIEVSFHAMLLQECGVGWVGHTHPIAVNQLLCSEHAETFAQNRTCPDEVVLCGPESVFVPYVDPGLPLALAIREQVRAYMQTHGEAPKVVLLANHGVIALGNTPAEILNIMAMCVKSARILVGAYSVGKPVFMSKADIMHIYKRPDEIYRRQRFVDEG
ncbi:MAG: class II aldolase/adducin family protein [Aggregatilineales bacterium]